VSALRRLPQITESALLHPLPPSSRYILRGGTQALAAAAAALRLPPSSAVCRAQVTDARAALWLGPDERLLLAPESEFDAMTDALASALAGLPHALVDVAHRQVALEVRGPHATTALSTGCPLDLHPSAFPVGMCTRTVLGRVEIVLWRTAIQGFHLEVGRSYAAYVSALLAEAAGELLAQD
jgi:sarcosine oxidase subunit gamma